MIRRPPRSTLSSSSAASDVYKRQMQDGMVGFSSDEDEEDDKDVMEHFDPDLKDSFETGFDLSKMAATLEQSFATLDGSGKSLDLRDAMVLSLIHISEPTRLLSISYAVFCLKKKKKQSNLLL
eukprot:TRINITY_DN53626_c0_g1_i1.p2 TRINITY_DN53626_c0_g1~~TRINITY_DN53626_c0_g1_i1.p2  ORF type:complete len:123 (-),score=51.52 TRINITY_DN53626_c0_g1_i1:62-430(-)